MAKEVDGDAGELDGYEDLEEDDQARIRQALADGHVADEDIVGIVSGLDSHVLAT